MRRHPELAFCVSVTTRRPRAGEAAGVNYIFTDIQDFDRRAAKGEFLESANVYGNLYGTPHTPVEELLGQGRDVMLEKDPQGARSIKQIMPDAILVFIAPPSVDELKSRIMKRGTETDADLMHRLGCAGGEMNQIRRFDYVVVNYEVADSVMILEAIITAERHRVGDLKSFFDECPEETLAIPAKGRNVL